MCKYACVLLCFKETGIDLRDIQKTKDNVKYALSMLDALFDQKTLGECCFSRTDKKKFLGPKKPLLDEKKVAVMEGN